MASKAKAAFDENVEDIKRLLKLHEEVGGTKPGRRYGVEVLNKSAIVLITAFWEAYCEDIAAEGLKHIMKHASSADALPDELRKEIARKLGSARHELEVWKIADGGWRTYLANHLDELKEQRDRKLNTPKTDRINELFKSVVGIEKISRRWYWQKMSSEGASKRLDEYVSLRGEIAHRGNHETSVKKQNVTDYFGFVQLLAGKTDDAVNEHIKKITGKQLRHRKRAK